MITTRSLVVALALVAGCKSGDKAPAAGSAAPMAAADGSAAMGSAAPGSAAAIAAGSGELKSVAPSQDLTTIGSRMNYELLHRPKLGPSAEQVLAAFDKAGIKVTDLSQYLGSTVKAAYCAGGRTSAGVVVAICEYETPEAAQDGKKFMDDRFKAMAKNAVRHVRGGTVLTLSGGAVTAETSRPFFAVFDSL